MGDSNSDGMEDVILDDPFTEPSPSPELPPMDPDPLLPPDSPTIPPNPPSFPSDAPPTSPAPTPQPTVVPPEPDPTPLPLPDPLPDDFQSFILSLVNAARAQSRDCGDTFFPAAPPVNWDDRIESAALGHSQDMAQNENFSHTGTDGSNAGDRLLMEGYDWNRWGENILVGLDDAAEAIDAWIDSPGHCSIIMTPSYEEVGAGVAQGLFQGGTASYWTLVFATEN